MTETLQMLLIQLIKVIIETAFKSLPCQDQDVLAARQRLTGKVLRMELVELKTSVILIFGKLRIYVLKAMDDTADCTIRVRFITLLALVNRNCWTQFIKQGDLEVDGDLQLAQLLVELLNMTEYDVAELLSPWLGDVIAEGIIRVMTVKIASILKRLSISKERLTLAITDEWQIIPSMLEHSWFCSEVNQLNLAEKSLVDYLEKLEALRR